MHLHETFGFTSNLEVINTFTMVEAKSGTKIDKADFTYTTERKRPTGMHKDRPGHTRRERPNSHLRRAGGRTSRSRVQRGTTKRHQDKRTYVRSGVPHVYAGHGEPPSQAIGRTSGPPPRILGTPGDDGKPITSETEGREDDRPGPGSPVRRSLDSKTEGPSRQRKERVVLSDTPSPVGQERETGFLSTGGWDLRG